ncbi:hypothetical protein FRC12_015218 [Ceratobasidium sp. 428]|nr:hypothetical protein FRC12_015218 [Ceratobasidium sp. 428]
MSELRPNPPPNRSAEPHVHELRQLGDARRQLSCAIQPYLEACTALEAAGSASSLSTSFANWPDRFFQSIVTETCELATLKQNLHTAGPILLRMRNQSRKLTPISALPLEILATIFSMADDNCLRSCFSLHSSNSEPEEPAFASVCIQWRKIYHRWHPTASHLDLVAYDSVSSRYYARAEVLVGRSPNAALHLVIQDTKCDDEPTTSHASKLVQFLKPLMPRVHAVDLTLRANSQFLLDSLLACWVMYGSSSSLKCLKIWNRSRLEAQIRAPAQTALEEQISTEQLNNFFEPIQTLVLVNCYASPGSGVYKELAHLRLAGLHESSTPLNIFEIITASPCLRSLAINNNVFLEPDEPAWVDSLEVLSLMQSRVQGGLKNFLPWLNSKSNSISVIMQIVKDPNFVLESQDFFRRSSVTRLYAYSDEGRGITEVAQLCPTANLQELILERCNIRIDQQEASLTIMVDNHRYTRTPWPRLHTLYLITCMVELESFQQLLALHPIRRLRMYNCSLLENNWPTFDYARVEKQLSDATGIDVICISDVPAGSPTRTGFSKLNITGLFSA